MLSRASGRELHHLAIRAIGRVDLGLVAAAVRGRADEPDLGSLEVCCEPAAATRRNDRVVVENDEDVAGSGARAPG